MKKSPEIAFIEHKLKFTPNAELSLMLEQVPLSVEDKAFLTDIKKGLSYKQLADKYGRSVSRVWQWKHNLYIYLHKYYLANLKKIYP